ncbi:MAG: MerR family transcriptional regulator, partial [Atribacterota bacterium]|nr:MerR family transcriptional regulator [Atribacterota bacterium]
ILLRVDLRTLERLKNKKEEKQENMDSQIDKNDKKIFKKRIKRSIKRYNMVQTARILQVSRGTLYYWIKKGWIKPKRDHKGYPVFTTIDIENIIKWKNK